MLSKFLFLGGLGATEITLIVFAILLLFGGRKIPELMRGLGKGVKEFKTGMKEKDKNDKKKIKEKSKDSE